MNLGATHSLSKRAMRSGKFAARVRALIHLLTEPNTALELPESDKEARRTLSLALLALLPLVTIHALMTHLTSEVMQMASLLAWVFVGGVVACYALSRTQHYQRSMAATIVFVTAMCSAIAHMYLFQHQESSGLLWLFVALMFCGLLLTLSQVIWASLLLIATTILGASFFGMTVNEFQILPLGSAFVSVGFVWIFAYRREQKQAQLLEKTQTIGRLERELERKVLERTQSLNVEVACLQDTVQRRDSLLSTLNQEMRRSSRAIAGMGEALRLGVHGETSDQHKIVLGRIEHRSLQILSLLNDVREIAEIDSGMMTLETRTVDVGGLGKRCMDTIERAAVRKNILLTYSADSNADQVWGDAARLAQIVVTLLRNSIKYTPPSGRVGLKIVENEAGDSVYFTVWDTGVGISPDDRATLFDSTSSEEANLNSGDIGAGLRLSLVKRLVELHEGTISVRSEVGVGTVVTIELPRDNPRPLVAREPAKLRQRVW